MTSPAAIRTIPGVDAREDLVELRVKIPRAMRQQLRVARLLQNRSMTEIVTEALGAALPRLAREGR